MVYNEVGEVSKGQVLVRRVCESNSKKMRGFPNGELEQVTSGSWKPILHIVPQLLVQCCHVTLTLLMKTYFHRILSTWDCVFEACSMCFICHTSCAKKRNVQNSNSSYQSFENQCPVPTAQT